MKYLMLSTFGLLLLLSSCEPKPEKVIEESWSAEQPKLIAYYMEEGEEKVKVNEEKFYEDGKPEYTGGFDADGKRHGEWKYYYRNGTLWSLGNYYHGIKTGKKEVYWPDGIIRYEGFFADDKKSGHWIFYDMEGKILEEKDY